MMSKTILLLIYGNRYSRDDIARLSMNKEYNYLIYTDNPSEYSDYETVHIDPDLGTFNKILMLQENRGPCLYLDLDIILQNNNLDYYFEAGYSKPAICKTYWKPEGFEAEFGGGDFNSSVMSWNGDNAMPIYEHFVRDSDYWIVKYKEQDDNYLFYEHGSRFSVYAPNRIYSYLYGMDYENGRMGSEIYLNCDICLLNGQDRVRYDLRTEYKEKLLTKSETSYIV